MSPDGITWKLEPHTQGKHLVLRNYMEAWLPIMTRWNGRVLFIDGFAGPGEYDGGEPGSPIIALQALMEHRARNQMKSNISYLFIEKDADRCHHLREVLLRLDSDVPQNCTHHVFHSTFDETLTDVLDRIDEQNRRLAPSFVMIDPFGVSGTPMKTIARILGNPKSEVYISFMYEALNRFRDQPSFGPHLDDLFGCPDWKQGIDITDTKERKSFFFDLYKERLRASGAKYVLHFELYEGQRLVYAIFFGTQSLDGCDKMKQAIWKVVPFGDFKFRGSQLGQLTLGVDLVDFDILEKALHERFGPKGWVKVDEVEDFVKSDATEFHSSHLRIKTLKPMESRGAVEVKPGTRKKAGSYPSGTVLRLVQQNT